MKKLSFFLIFNTLMFISNNVLAEIGDILYQAKHLAGRFAVMGLLIFIFCIPIFIDMWRNPDKYEDSSEKDEESQDLAKVKLKTKAFHQKPIENFVLPYRVFKNEDVNTLYKEFDKNFAPIGETSSIFSVSVRKIVWSHFEVVFLTEDFVEIAKQFRKLFHPDAGLETLTKKEKELIFQQFYSKIIVSRKNIKNK